MKSSINISLLSWGLCSLNGFLNYYFLLEQEFNCSMRYITIYLKSMRLGTKEKTGATCGPWRSTRIKAHLLESDCLDLTWLCHHVCKL
jgi:hypothetical protein